MPSSPNIKLSTLYPPLSDGREELQDQERPAPHQGGGRLRGHHGPLQDHQLHDRGDHQRDEEPELLRRPGARAHCVRPEAGRQVPGKGKGNYQKLYIITQKNSGNAENVSECNNRTIVTQELTNILLMPLFYFRRRPIRSRRSSRASSSSPPRPRCRARPGASPRTPGTAARTRTSGPAAEQRNRRMKLDVRMYNANYHTITTVFKKNAENKSNSAVLYDQVFEINLPSLSTCYFPYKALWQVQT